MGTPAGGAHRLAGEHRRLARQVRAGALGGRRDHPPYRRRRGGLPGSRHRAPRRNGAALPAPGGSEPVQCPDRRVPPRPGVDARHFPPVGARLLRRIGRRPLPLQRVGQIRQPPAGREMAALHGAKARPSARGGALEREAGLHGGGGRSTRTARTRSWSQRNACSTPPPSAGIRASPARTTRASSRSGWAYPGSFGWGKASQGTTPTAMWTTSAAL